MAGFLVVTRTAERLEVAFIERRSALVDWLDVVHHRRYSPVADFAKRVEIDIVLPGLLPSGRRIEGSVRALAPTEWNPFRHPRPVL